MSVQDWLLRIGDGEHFTSSSRMNIWGVDSSDNSNIGFFLRNVKAGDRLWFILSKAKGKVHSVATFTEIRQREIGPLINFTLSNEELGWTKQNGSWDKEIHYKNLYTVVDVDLLTEIKSPKVVRLYNPEKCKLNLPIEYGNIVKYSKAKFIA